MNRTELVKAQVKNLYRAGKIMPDGREIYTDKRVVPRMGDQPKCPEDGVVSVYDETYEFWYCPKCGGITHWGPLT